MSYLAASYTARTSSAAASVTPTTVVRAMRPFHATSSASYRYLLRNLPNNSSVDAVHEFCKPFTIHKMEIKYHNPSFRDLSSGYRSPNNEFSLYAAVTLKPAAGMGGLWAHGADGQRENDIVLRELDQKMMAGKPIRVSVSRVKGIQRQDVSTVPEDARTRGQFWSPKSTTASKEDGEKHEEYKRLVHELYPPEHLGI